MFKYFHIIRFLMTHDLTELKKHWCIKVIKKRQFKWGRLFKSFMFANNYNHRYWAWWRLAKEMYCSDNEIYRQIGYKINEYLILKYNCDIRLGAKVGKNCTIIHFVGITVSEHVEIGDNLSLHQCVTIGSRKAGTKIKIGNNVVIGCNSVILGGQIAIGDTVYIGAMSYIDKDIPSDCIVYTEKTNKITQKHYDPFS